MKIISFGKTTPALLAGRKTVTRREWAAKHAASFSAGELVQAWNQSPRVKGSRRVGTIRLTAAPYLQSTAIAPPRDWEGEGFAYMEEHAMDLPWHRRTVSPSTLWRNWYESPVDLWVVRFELVEVLR